MTKDVPALPPQSQLEPLLEAALVTLEGLIIELRALQQRRSAEPTPRCPQLA